MIQSTMSKVGVTLICFLCLLFIHSSDADVGTAAQYGPPFLPTACYGEDSSEFPGNKMLGSAGEGIWDNGAACGREYEVRCISAAGSPRTCIAGNTVRVKIVDRALSSSTRSPPSSPRASVVLSTTAFAAIANASASLINIEFQQV